MFILFRIIEISDEEELMEVGDDILQDLLSGMETEIDLTNFEM